MKMNYSLPHPLRTFFLFLITVPCLVPTLFAELTVPGDGSDGALVITEDTQIDLALAQDGLWHSASSGDGVYDSEKWAVVFKYTSVNIAAGATVTFINHPSRAPVVWLVQGNVTIDGTVSLDGQRDVDAPRVAEPGPGGFRGGMGYFSSGLSRSSGFGPGGGYGGNWGWGGGFGNSSALTGSVYGNPSLLPLIGGSGGGGYSGDGRGGGAGGGAILIACSGDMAINGIIRANGGGQRNGGGSGSGGAVRLVSHSLQGSGSVQCLAGSGGNVGGFGRVRIERVINSSSLVINPAASVVTLLDGSEPLLWLPMNGPTVRVVSIGGSSVPEDPRAFFDASGPDVALPQTATTQVVVETTNVESESQVLVRVTPRANADFTEVLAGSPEVLNANPLRIRWTAEIPVQAGNSAVQVRVKRP